MKPSVLTPTGVERTFGDEEIIVSKTDTKGLLRYVNDVFVRVSGYPEEDLIGQPHNVIRHPEMPRAVFKLLWDTISSGHELFAYINNLSADGANYWVFAHVTPSLDASGKISGFHSNRRVPERAAVRDVNEVYRRLLAEERRHSSSSQAVAASTKMLDDMLQEVGVSYQEWVWTFSPAMATVGEERT